MSAQMCLGALVLMNARTRTKRATDCLADDTATLYQPQVGGRGSNLKRSLWKCNAAFYANYYSWVRSRSLCLTFGELRSEVD